MFGASCCVYLRLCTDGWIRSLTHRDIAYRRAVSILRFNTAHTASICQPIAHMYLRCKIGFLHRNEALTRSDLCQCQTNLWINACAVEQQQYRCLVRIYLHPQRARFSALESVHTHQTEVSIGRRGQRMTSSASSNLNHTIQPSSCIWPLSITGRSWAQFRLCTGRSPSARQFASLPSHRTTPREHCHKRY